MTWPPGASWVTSWVRPSPQMDCCWLGCGRGSGPRLQIWTSLAKFSSVCWWAQGSGGQNVIILGQALHWGGESDPGRLSASLHTRIRFRLYQVALSCGPIKHHLQLECACYSTTWRGWHTYKHFPDQKGWMIFLTKLPTLRSRCRASSSITGMLSSVYLMLYLCFSD